MFFGRPNMCCQLWPPKTHPSLTVSYDWNVATAHVSRPGATWPTLTVAPEPRRADTCSATQSGSGTHPGSVNNKTSPDAWRDARFRAAYGLG